MKDSRSKRMIGRVGLVVATAVVSVTLAGSGVASAFTVPINSVNSAKIIDNTVRSIDIKDGTVRSVDVADNNLTGSDIADGTVGTVDVADNDLTGGDILDGSIVSTDIGDGSVSGGDIANGSVTTSDLAPTAVTRWAKIDADATGTSIIRGRGVVGSTRAGTGQFTVTFLQAIDTCGWSATVNDNDSGLAPALFASVERNTVNDANTLRVRVWDAAGALVDPDTGDGFTVTVTC